MADRDRAALSAALARVGEGSQAALAEVYSETSAKLFGVCLRILGDRGEAEDVLQDVYINVWRHAGGFDPRRSSPITWLSALARNRAIDRIRARGHRPTAPLEAAAEVADDAPDALALVSGDQEAGRLSHCLGELDARSARAIRAAFFDGRSYAELAGAEGVPLGTMKSWVRRGLLRLRGCLDR
ncbi:MAG: RNA polymerase sigma-70 factor [uncultured Sphingomonadaceae bacterium]|uniref:RNA polymerase sigma-70 factor n=1 Tax=uncultured Sphingomonadaceae bacterium TaxID=169976 RepID=A0A6J4SRI8_9SPHN|nr:MAG: RNA polymerase sigma-70 factor [uncultured Sphingomonadaceae bacterium]